MSREPGKPGVHKVSQIPVGLERVLYLAATEPAFREALMQDREAAVISRGLALRPSELAMLRAVPAAELERHVDGMYTSPDNLRRRTFMGAVAASAMTIAAADALSGCKTTGDKGARPDFDQSIKAGIPPDMPSPPADTATGEDSKATPDTVAAPDMGPAGTGIRPGDSGRGGK